MDKIKQVYRSKEEIQNHIKNYYHSGLSQSEYCRRNKISKSSLSSWLRRYKKKQDLEKRSKSLTILQESPFMQLPLQLTPSTFDLQINIGNNISIKANQSYPIDSLIRLSQGLI